jgi:hypothetical protein
MRKAAFLAVMATMLLMCASVYAEGDAKVFDSFEGANDWTAENWDNVGGVTMIISAEKFSDGKQSLKAAAKNESEDWKNRFVISREAALDLSTADMYMDIYTDAPSGVSVAIAFDTAGEYYESGNKLLNQGWNKDIKFELGAKDFKCKASDWKNSVPLADRSDISKVFILVQHPKKMKDVTVFIDNIRFK